jgi:hypothetical protein
MGWLVRSSPKTAPTWILRLNVTRRHADHFSMIDLQRALNVS